MSKQKYKGDAYDMLSRIETELDEAEVVIQMQKTDIKRLIILLIENDVPIPEDLIDSYILKADKSKESSFEYDEDELPFY